MLVRYFVRRKIVGSHAGKSSSGRLWAASEPDILRRPQKYLRYRVLCIPPASRRPFNDQATKGVAPPTKLNPAGGCNTLRATFRYWAMEFGRPLVRRSTNGTGAPIVSCHHVAAARGLFVTLGGRTGGNGNQSSPSIMPKDRGVTRMARRRWLHCLIAACLAGVTACAAASVVREPESSSIIRVSSKDGTLLAVECAGAGPSLVIVHGGTGDRSRWTPLFPLFASRFRVCAMDRRSHGASGDSPDYSLQKEAEDVAAVVNSQPGQVFLLGHSLGGVAALEAAFLTNKISKLVLYEPPLQDLDHSAVLARMERMIQEGDREQALVAFLQEIVMISPSEIVAMKARPSWPGLLASIESSIRQGHALIAYRFDPKRMSTLNVPTLLLTGSESASPQLKQAISGLLDSLPNRSLFVFEGQEHNAMDTVPQQFAEAVGSFLLGTKDKTSREGR